MKYAIYNYEFAGKIDYEDKYTISINGSRWAKWGDYSLRYITCFEYLMWKFAKKIIEKINR